MKYGFIVEGHLESDIISHLCRGAEIRRLRLNGREVSIQKIASLIFPHVIILLKKTNIVHIILDREQRKITSDQMRLELISCLQNGGIDCSRVVVGVPDRNIESWIAPFLDREAIFQREAFSKSFDGENGKGYIKEVYRSNGRKYVEVVDGVNMFKALIPSKAAEVSESFSKLFGDISDHCWWKTRG